MKYPTPAVGLIRQAQGMLEYDSYEKLSNIKSETLVLGGEEDIMIHPENFSILSEKIPEAQLKIFKNSGHSCARTEKKVT